MDLFPGITLPEPDYKILLAAIKENCDRLNLQKTEFFLTKILQVSQLTLDIIKADVAYYQDVC